MYERFEHNGLRWYDCGASGFLPSITTILGHTEPPETTARLEAWRDAVGHAEADAIVEEAARRGTMLHLMMENHVLGRPQSDARESDVRLFIGLKRHLKPVGTVYGTELAMHSDAYGLAGTADMVCDYNGIPSIVDYKTARRAKRTEDIGDYWLQCAFYAAAFEEQYGLKIEQLVILMAVDNGLPMKFVKNVDPGLGAELLNRVNLFYEMVSNAQP